MSRMAEELMREWIKKKNAEKSAEKPSAAFFPQEGSPRKKKTA